MTAAPGRRLYAPVVLGLLATGGVAWLALGRTWASTTLRPTGLPADTVAVTGREVVPLAAALAVVVVTAALAVLATRGRVRIGVGVLVVLLGLGGAALCLASSGEVDRTVASAAEQSPAFTGQRLGDVATTAWPYGAAVGFLLAAGLGGVAVRYGRSWPAMSGRYDAPSSARDDDDPWKALDEGRDPTL